MLLIFGYCTWGPGRLTLKNLTLTNGAADLLVAFGQGGGLFNNGGVATVENSAFLNNHGGTGGGLANNNGAVTIIGSTFDSNSSGGGGGGALANSGELTIIESTFS